MPLQTIITVANTVSRASASWPAPPEELERDDQRHFDDGDGEGEDQGAEGLADTVGDGFRVLARIPSRWRPARAASACRDEPAERSTPDGAKHRAGEDRRGDGPWRQGERLGSGSCPGQGAWIEAGRRGANGKQYTDDWKSVDVGSCGGAAKDFTPIAAKLPAVLPYGIT
jgi:hypothetical protein